MTDEIFEPWEELSKEDLEQIFRETINSLNNLHETLVAASEDVGYTYQVVKALYPRYISLMDKAEEDPSLYPIVYSGAEFIRSLGTQIEQFGNEAKDIYAPLTPMSNSTGTVSSSTDAAVYLYNVKLPDDIQLLPPLPSRKSRDEYLEYLNKLNPSLANAYTQVWQIYYGTTSDKCRASLFMMRQVFDHFFSILAPDDQVRKSDFWSPKKGDKPEQIYRSERIQFAATKHIKITSQVEALSISSKQINDLYEAANRAHQRGLLDEIKAEKALLSMNQVLIDWIDSINIFNND